MSLAGDEMPHERVGAEIHSTGVEAHGVAPTQLAVPATTQKDPTLPQQGAPGKPMLVIESGKVASDDDPTTILIRDSGPTKVDDHLAVEDDSLAREIADDRKPTTAEPVAARRGSSKVPREETSSTRSSSTRLRVLILILALTLGAAGAWYYLRGGF
jgi:hypothetical protein